MMMYTVVEVMELTNQKKGTVELFRNELQKYKIIGNNASLDDEAVKVFRQAIQYKEEAVKKTWTECMQKAIQIEYSHKMELPFYWTNNAILNHLIWLIENKIVETVQISNNDVLDYRAVYFVIMDNFRELGKGYDIYKNSSGTDGNPMLTFKCTGKNYLYYIAGKYNSITGEEDMHVFYNDDLEFNIMKCKHICGGNSNEGLLGELYAACVKAIN